jgi:hypothetical protein
MTSSTTIDLEFLSKVFFLTDYTSRAYSEVQHHITLVQHEFTEVPSFIGTVRIRTHEALFYKNELNIWLCETFFLNLYKNEFVSPLSLMLNHKNSFSLEELLAALAVANFVGIIKFGPEIYKDDYGSITAAANIPFKTFKYIY